MSIFVLNIPVDLQDQIEVSQNLESDPIHNKKGNDFALNIHLVVFI